MIMSQGSGCGQAIILKLLSNGQQELDKPSILSILKTGTQHA
jgi:hypothetical protein